MLYQNFLFWIRLKRQRPECYNYRNIENEELFGGQNGVENILFKCMQHHPPGKQEASWDDQC